MIETKPKTQKERLLELFQRKHTWSNHELRALNPAVYQFPVRIKELREDGYDIRGYFDKSDKKLYLYTLYRPGDEPSLFGGIA